MIDTLINEAILELGIDPETWASAEAEEDSEIISDTEPEPAFVPDPEADTELDADLADGISPDDDDEIFEELDQDLKNWYFEENIRLQETRRELEEESARLKAYENELEEKARDISDRSDKFIKERAQFRDEMNLLTSQVTRERQRLKQDQQFFDKKMDILKSGFAELEKAKREFEAEKIRHEAKASSSYYDEDVSGYGNGTPVARSMFRGITNPLMLKKRYKDLVKIYHPDNLAGDRELFNAITIEYERLQVKIGSEGIG